MTAPLRILVGLAGNGWSLSPGDRYEPEDEAEAGRMIASRLAEPWSDELAAKPAGEKRDRAVKPARAKRAN
jgi:hypothetical protein